MSVMLLFQILFCLLPVFRSSPFRSSFSTSSPERLLVCGRLPSTPVYLSTYLSSTFVVQCHRWLLPLPSTGLSLLRGFLSRVLRRCSVFSEFAVLVAPLPCSVSVSVLQAKSDDSAWFDLHHRVHEGNIFFARSVRQCCAVSFSKDTFLFCSENCFIWTVLYRERSLWGCHSQEFLKWFDLCDVVHHSLSFLLIFDFVTLHFVKSINIHRRVCMLWCDQVTIGIREEPPNHFIELNCFVLLRDKSVWLRVRGDDHC